MLVYRLGRPRARPDSTRARGPMRSRDGPAGRRPTRAARGLSCRAEMRWPQPPQLDPHSQNLESASRLGAPGPVHDYRPARRGQFVNELSPMGNLDHWTYRPGSADYLSTSTGRTTGWLSYPQLLRIEYTEARVDTHIAGTGTGPTTSESTPPCLDCSALNILS
jgi:hypothetical protein